MTAPQRLTDRKRLAILDTAEVQFRLHGFDGVSMDKIAAEAGVSKRTVYNHFPSKDELFGEMLVRLFQRSAAELELPYRSDTTLRVQLSELMSIKLRGLTNQEFLDLARVAIAEAMRSPDSVRRFETRMSEREEGVTAWIRAAQADGKLKPCDPVFVAALLQGQIKALAFWPQVTMGAPLLSSAQQGELIATVVGMFLAYFAHPKHAA